MEVEWLSENLNDFYYFLAQLDIEVYGNELIKVLLEQQQYSDQVAYKVFLPYLIYMVASLTYFSFYLPANTVRGGFFGEEGFRVQATARFFVLIGACLFLFIEIV